MYVGEGGGGQLTGGAMTLGKLSVPGRPANLINSKAWAYCACIGYG